ncbi:16S rRNA (guanine(966)-N(2))-methyltransferase RsmD [Desulfonatronovibrio hydrogenovorans]|uniref:16S rRNA (guanine(966)-N(2))-methyltransferase RsmD n=1 Tax=Desulfonatronovibrio hydrogenovorans TaxID=53245 RepID=UPI00048CF597|nr:16S rRNA (guanine(966)-N(2))-methyltransferase RsmD [Desulfonatronovibrio hydrogenovorans]
MRIISGKFKGRIIKTGSGPGYRPATGKVRESLFSMLESMGIDWSKARVLDIFAGSGSLGFEALSRGAGSVHFIEKSALACSIIRENIAALDISKNRAVLIKADALNYSAKKDLGHFDLIFIDPPYGQGLMEPVLNNLLLGPALVSGTLISAETEYDSAQSLDHFPGLALIRDRNFGQTRILLWEKT